MNDKLNYEAIGKAVVDLVSGEPCEPSCPSRVGQWFKHSDETNHIYGPIVRSDTCGHWGAAGGSGLTLLLNEHDIARGSVLRIPPPPADAPDDAPDDLQGWECREPMPGEKHYATDGVIEEGTCFEDPDYGRRRWIEPTPARKPWPVGPFEVDDRDPGWHVAGREGLICSKSTYADAEAIALALNLLPEYVAFIRGLHYYGSQNTHKADHDALIAKWDKAGFETPGDRPSTKENDDE